MMRKNEKNIIINFKLKFSESEFIPHIRLTNGSSDK